MPLRVTEEANAAPGFIQAFDVRTGKLAWVFHTIPQPGEPGAETWSEHAHENFNVGGANNWPGMAIDAKRGLLFAPTGSASPDFWGGARIGQNLYANCLLALDARTGKLRWHFQFVHHDLWDRDPPSPPVLLTIHRNGKPVDVVVQTLKSGLVFVFNRDTGESIFPYEERSVPKSQMPGEVAWATQPFPLKPAPISRQILTENDLSPYAENREEILSMFRQARFGPYEPFGKDDTLIFPGFDGGPEWGGPAVDPDGTLYVNCNEMAWLCRLQDKQTATNLEQMSPGHRVYAQWCFGCHGLDRKGNPASGYPSLIDIKNRKARDEVMTQITTGRGMMPGFPWMKDDQKQLLVDYLFDTERVEGAQTSERAQPAAAKTAPSPEAYAPFEIVGYVKFLDRNGYPAISPPWGSMTAVDLNTGEHKWHITLGEFKELTAKGIPPTGTENYGGPVVTASGLLFIAATKDGMIRAFDKRDGKVLWQTELPAAGFATPAMYAVGGKKYLVVAAGGT
jgi:quinoprotein glucose dehydrogenase